MLNHEYCGRCEKVIEPQDSYYVARAGWERFLLRSGWTWTQLGWTCPECAATLTDPRDVAPDGLPEQDVIHF